VACHSEWAEGAKMSAIVQRNQAERNDDQQNGLFMDMPAEEERGIGA
jgi:hypothetical protein